jgi:flavin-dependent dehydrogenase
VRSRYDVVVIGAGPGGTTTAAQLARAGADVLLIEGTSFPRWHIGESLLAASMPILAELGLAARLERFQRKLGALWVWGPALSLIRLGMPRPGFAYQVQRDEFDLLLAQNAVAAGVEVRHEHWAREPVLDADGRVTGVTVSTDGAAPSPVHARYVVDASGLFQFLPRKLGLPMDQFGPKRAALTGYWTGAARPVAPYTADVISEATPDGWLWFIPFEDGATGVGFVGDSADIDKSVSGTMLFEQIKGSQLIRRLLDGAELTRRQRLLRYTNHTVRSPLWGGGYLLVGDTAAFVDPLFSTGINATLHSAVAAAAGISSVLAGDLDEAAAAAWYDRRVRGHYRRTTEMTRLLYAAHPGESRFWRARSLAAISPERAEDMLRAVGPTGLELFIRASKDGAIRLPDPVAERLPEFDRPLPLTRPPAGSVLWPAPDTLLVPDWTRQGTRLVPATRLAHRRGRTQEFDFPAGGPADRMLRALDGQRELAEVIGGLADPASAQARKLALLAGALIEAGLLSARTRPGEIGPRHAQLAAR